MNSKGGHFNELVQPQWLLLQDTAVDYNIFKDIAAQTVAQFVN